MRASPAFRVSVLRFGVWRVAVGVTLLAAAMALAAWAATRDEFTPLWLGAGAIAAGVAVLLAGAGWLRVRPLSLRWDSREWLLGPVESAGDEPWRGRLAVAIDLNAWMLLRFVADSPSNGPRTRWIPVQRRGLEADWHALRCAVYCARPASGSDAGTTPANAFDTPHERP